MIDHIIVNFFGGPSCGKTTAAADLFVSLKKHSVECLLPGEFAQECILEGNANSLKDQLYVLGNTYHRQLSAYEQATVTVIDSPILLSCVYQDNMPESFNSLILDLHNRFHNLNILLDIRPNNNHSMVGRVHSFNESIGIDEKIERMLNTFAVPFVRQSDILDEGKELTPYLTREILEYLNA